MIYDGLRSNGLLKVNKAFETREEMYLPCAALDWIPGARAYTKKKSKKKIKGFIESIFVIEDFFESVLTCLLILNVLVIFWMLNSSGCSFLKKNILKTKKNIGLIIIFSFNALNVIYKWKRSHFWNEFPIVVFKTLHAVL